MRKISKSSLFKFYRTDITGKIFPMLHTNANGTPKDITLQSVDKQYFCRPKKSESIQ